MIILLTFCVILDCLQTNKQIWVKTLPQTICYEFFFNQRSQVHSTFYGDDRQGHVEQYNV